MSSQLILFDVDGTLTRNDTMFVFASRAAGWVPSTSNRMSWEDIVNGYTPIPDPLLRLRRFDARTIPVGR
ncbi:MAG: hypothetical protein AAFV53_11420, partial [Myxococcota bacterium]